MRESREGDYSRTKSLKGKKIKCNEWPMFKSEFKQTSLKKKVF